MYLIVPFALVAFSLLPLARVLVGVVRARRSIRWPEIPGEVLEVEDASIALQRTDVARMLPVTIVRYAYVAGGARQTGAAAATRRMIRVAGMLRRLDTLRPGEILPVRVDPARPERSTLTPGVAWSEVPELLLAMALLATAALLFTNVAPMNSRDDG